MLTMAKLIAKTALEPVGVCRAGARAHADGNAAGGESMRMNPTNI
jgi:hypothetical protein